jgi:phosphoglycolate phosphatase
VVRDDQVVSRAANAGVVFDLDGVLVDSVAPVTSAINGALAHLGRRTLPLSELRRFIGPPQFSSFSELIGEPADSTAVASIVADYRARYEQLYLTQTTVIDGVRSMLAELSADRPLAIATSKSVTFTRPLLDALGLSSFFAVVAAAAPEDIADDKTAIVGRAISALGQTPVAMVGDRSFDVVAAHAHALLAVGVTWGIGSVEELRAAGADRLIDRPGELIGMVQEVGGRSA